MGREMMWGALPRVPVTRRFRYCTSSIRFTLHSHTLIFFFLSFYFPSMPYFFCFSISPTWSSDYRAGSDALSKVKIMDPRRLNEKASQETFISLLQLDPTPMESSPNPDTKPDVDKDLPPLPEHQSEDSFKPQDATGSSTTSIGLSGSGRGTTFYCQLL